MLPQRVLEKIYIEPNTGCWIWEGYWGTNGYGVICRTTGPTYVHRLVWESFFGPTDLHLHHICETRCCCNPAHIVPVTRSQHIARHPNHYSQVLKAKTHCPHGHEYTPENTTYRHGWRECRRCIADRTSRWRIRQSKHS